MTPTLYLVLVDDWELRGDGSGDPRQIQFKPMRELVRIFDRYGIRGSFNAEVMQQLTFRKYEGSVPELKELADAWDEAVLATFRQGHDIQLHIHPQWVSAVYKGNDRWMLNTDWSILNYEMDVVRGMVVAGKEYLERLLGAVDPEYRCVSFRAGSWCLAPSPHILRTLSESGILFDISVVGGVKCDNRHVKLDYTNCQESFVPFYPEMTDARQVARKPQPIVCIPTNHFRDGTLSIMRRDLRRAVSRVSMRRRASIASLADPGGGYKEWVVPRSMSGRIRQKLTSYFRGNIYISDIAQLDYGMLSLMMRSIRNNARKTGLAELPVVLASHTKDIQDFSHIEKFVADIAAAPDVRCITLTQLARKLTSGNFAVRTRGNLDSASAA